MKQLSFYLLTFSKAGVIFVFLFFIFQSSFSQGVWTWVKGSNIPAQMAIFGIQRISSSNSVPPAVYEPCEWTDLQGNFWLLGGVDSNRLEYGDLWKYDPYTNEWTWMKGTGISADKGNYGVMGVPAITNQPPARAWGTYTWVDLNGDLWMYGGACAAVGTFSDLWKYSIASNTWTWMQGSSSNYMDPVYGTKGIPSTDNTPGMREEGSATWVDSSGNLWLFGGSNGGFEYGDLWKYNIAINQWTWMSGSEMTGDDGIYGSLGVSSWLNRPGARTAYCSWKDLDGKFWLFGGGSFSGDFDYNDMWKFDPANNEWTWMSGSNKKSNSGSYGDVCKSSINFTPSSRIENRARWKDDCGKFWMYGGLKTDVGAFNDLWNFDPINLQWTLLDGDSDYEVPPSFGIIGVPNMANQPGGRLGAVGWKGNDGSMYLFGGFVSEGINKGWSPFNDLWKYQPDASCPTSSASINLGDDSAYCGTFTRVLLSNYKQTVWSTGVIGSQIVVTHQGTYWASINNSCGIASDTISLTLLPNPIAGFINSSRDNFCEGSGLTSVLKTDSSEGFLQWQSSIDGINFSNISGASFSSYVTPIVLSQTTFYRLVASSKSCANVTSNVVIVHILSAPIAIFSSSYNGKQVTFNSTGTSSNVVSYYWDFGDGNISTDANPVHNYNRLDTFTVCLTVYNNSNCSYTLCQRIDLLTGVENFDANNSIQLYPNPANNIINLAVNGLSGNYTLKIYNVLGQQVMQHQLNLNQTATIPVNLDKYVQGTYELILMNDKEYYSKRFVKER